MGLDAQGHYRSYSISSLRRMQRQINSGVSVDLLTQTGSARVRRGSRRLEASVEDLTALVVKQAHEFGPSGIARGDVGNYGGRWTRG